MQQVEKYLARRINRDVSPQSIDTGGNRLLTPGDLLDAQNCRYDELGHYGSVTNVKSNLLKPYPDMPSGETKCIGVISNHRDNSFIYFLWNIEGNHKVVEYFIDTEIFITLLGGPSLLFLNSSYITGKVLDNSVVFNDVNSSVRYIELIKARAGGYVSPYSKYQISLAVVPPLVPPTCALSTDAAIKVNKIAGNTWQAVYRWVFFDNRKSVFSPLSQIVYIRKNADPSNTTDNNIVVSGTIPDSLLGLIKKVEVAIRSNNDGFYTIFKTVDNPVINTFDVNFNNFENQRVVALSEQVKLSDQIPNVTDAVGLVNNRIFLPIDLDGFNVDSTGFTMASSFDNFTFRPGHGGLLTHPYIGDSKEFFVKTSGVYNLGVVFYDDFGRASFVQKITQVSVTDDILGVPASTVIKQKIRWTLAGTPPVGFSKYSIVSSKNQYQGTYFQCQAIVHFYVSELSKAVPPPGGNNADNTYYSGTYNWNGRIFRRYESGLPGTNTVYLQIPLNVPFIPDSTCYVKILNNDAPIRILEIQGVVGDFLVVSMTDALITWIQAEYFLPSFRIEVFTIRETNELTFYETGPMHDIVDGAFSNLSGLIEGDSYNLYIYDSNDSVFTESQNAHNYSPLNLEAIDPGVTTVPSQISLATTNRSWFAESPSGIFKGSVITVPVGIGSTSGGGSTTLTREVNTIDYTKAAWSIGRPRIEYSEAKQVDLYSSAGFSDPYIQGSLINGLNSFSVENQYTLPIERGRIRSFRAIDNVLVAIHERETSTLYIGQGFIKQGNDFILAKTTGVVGDDRKLLGGYGTINPESVCEAFDNLYWWDAYKGCIVRYSNAGLFPISSYGMESYFYAKSLLMFPYRNSLKITTEFHFQYNEFIISFPAIQDVMEAETWAFNIKRNEWKTRYTYTPDRMVSVGNNFFILVNGELWHQEKGDGYNNFCGVQYPRKFKFPFNPLVNKNKKILNIHINGDIAEVLESEDAVVRVTTPNGQESYIPAYEFVREEGSVGKWCAPMFRDINTIVPAGQLALRSGDEIIAPYMEVEVINSMPTKSPCSDVNVVFKTEEFSI